MAGRFDAINDRLAATTVLPTGTAYTILIWAKIVADPNDYQIFINARNGSRDIWVETGADGTSLEMGTAGTTSGAGDISNLRTLALNTWYRMALVVNGTSQTLYHGAETGALTASVPGTAPPDQFTPTTIYFGGDANGAYLRGDLANVQVYNAALTAAELENEFSQYQPSRVTNLLRWHPLVADLVDYSANGGALATNGTSPTLADGPPIAWRAATPHVTGVADTPIDSADSAAGTEATSVASTTDAVDSASGTETTAITAALAASDTAAGADAVALLRQASVTDTATGTDALAVTAIDYREVTDSATGAESIYVDIPELLYGTDSAAGADAAAIAAAAAAADAATASDATTLHRTSSTTDAATASDATTLHRTSSTTDSAAGTDVTTLLRLSTPSDAATGTESIAILRISAVNDSGTGTDLTTSGPLFFDYAVGSEDISIIEIAFTQVLPLVRRTLYDLVVVAMIPNASGPPAYLEIDPIEWSSLSWANTLSQPQELSASCLLASVSPQVLQRLNNLEDLPTELWLYRNGRKVFAGPLLAWKTSGEQLQLEARGLLAYLQSMIIDSDLKYRNVDQHLIVKALVDQWQVLEHGNLGIDTSGITPSGVLRTIEYIASEQHVVGRRVEELGRLAGGFDADVEPTTRALQLWSPAKGTDRSTGEDAIILDSRNITQADLMCSVAPDDLASESYGTASIPGLDDALVSKLGNAELRAKLGRRGVIRSFSNIGNQSDLDAANQAVLSARGQALIVPGTAVRVTPDSDLDDYGTGDTIGFDLRSPLGFTGAFRIRRQQVTVSADGGEENVDLQFV